MIYTKITNKNEHKRSVMSQSQNIRQQNILGMFCVGLSVHPGLLQTDGPQSAVKKSAVSIAPRDPAVSGTLVSRRNRS